MTCTNHDQDTMTSQFRQPVSCTLVWQTQNSKNCLIIIFDYRTDWTLYSSNTSDSDLTKFKKCKNIFIYWNILYYTAIALPVLDLSFSDTSRRSSQKWTMHGCGYEVTSDHLEQTTQRLADAAISAATINDPDNHSVMYTGVWSQIFNISHWPTPGKSDKTFL